MELVNRPPNSAQSLPAGAGRQLDHFPRGLRAAGKSGVSKCPGKMTTVKGPSGTEANAGQNCECVSLPPPPAGLLTFVHCLFQTSGSLSPQASFCPASVPEEGDWWIGVEWCSPKFIWWSPA